MRVLVVGENASIRMGGEATYPYFFFKLLREREIETWLVAHGRCGNELRKLLPDDLDRVHLTDDSLLERFLWWIGTFLHWKVREQTIGVLAQIVTQFRMRRIVAGLVKSERIDIVHQVYPISPRAPSAMYGLGAPVVIGPLSGDMDYPPAFQYMQSHASRTLQRIGRQAAGVINRLVPGKMRAESLIVANPQTRKALPRDARGVFYEGISEVSVDLKAFRYDESAVNARLRDGSVRFVYLGRLVDWKAVDLLLEAYRKVVDGAGSLSLELDILGDGPERGALEAQAERLGLGNRVHFAGWVGSEEAAARMNRSHVFVLPSLRESGGIVLMEAMALGLPVIASRWGGPDVHVDDATGIRVDPSSRDAFIAGLAEAMLRLARAPALRAEMGRAARERVQVGYYTWDRKIDRTLEIYRETLDRVVQSQSASAEAVNPRGG
jgi:glycosyltransferase involved in cell wall biosynthesis